jgi:hypothetical protein
MSSVLTKEGLEELFERAARIADRCGTATTLSDGDRTKHCLVGDLSIMRLYVVNSGSEAPFSDAVEVRVHRTGMIYRVATIDLGERLDVDYLNQQLESDGPRALSILRQAMVLDDLAQT